MADRRNGDALSGYDNGYRDTAERTPKLTDAQTLVGLEQADDYIKVLAGRLAYWEGRAAALRNRLGRPAPWKISAFLPATETRDREVP